MSKIKVIKLSPMKAAEVVFIENTLEAKQEFVGGDIQVVYPYEDLVAIVCDVEGKHKNYKPTRILFDEDGVPYDMLVGDCFIVGLSYDDFESVPDELIEKYVEKFKYPELIYRFEGSVYMKRIGCEEDPICIYDGSRANG